MDESSKVCCCIRNYKIIIIYLIDSNDRDNKSEKPVKIMNPLLFRMAKPRRNYRFISLQYCLTMINPKCIYFNVCGCVAKCDAILKETPESRIDFGSRNSLLQLNVSGNACINECSNYVTQFYMGIWWLSTVSWTSTFNCAMYSYLVSKLTVYFIGWILLPVLNFNES